MTPKHFFMTMIQHPDLSFEQKLRSAVKNATWDEHAYLWQNVIILTWCPAHQRGQYDPARFEGISSAVHEIFRFSSQTRERWSKRQFVDICARDIVAENSNKCDGNRTMLTSFDCSSYNKSCPRDAVRLHDKHPLNPGKIERETMHTFVIKESTKSKPDLRKDSRASERETLLDKPHCDTRYMIVTSPCRCQRRCFDAK
jgi:hypothetical protein